jgi:hypothetical protein
LFEPRANSTHAPFACQTFCVRIDNKKPACGGLVVFVAV